MHHPGVVQRHRHVECGALYLFQCSFEMMDVVGYAGNVKDRLACVDDVTQVGPQLQGEPHVFRRPKILQHNSRLLSIN